MIRCMDSSFDKDRAVILSVSVPMTTWSFSKTDTILSVVNNVNVISSLLTLVFMSRCFLYSLIRLDIKEIYILTPLNNMYYNEIPTLIQKLSVLSSHLNTQHIVLLSIKNVTISRILKYADILWNRTFGCIGRQAFNYYCSLLQVWWEAEKEALIWDLEA